MASADYFADSFLYFSVRHSQGCLQSTLMMRLHIDKQLFFGDVDCGYDEFHIYFIRT